MIKKILNVKDIDVLKVDKEFFWREEAHKTLISFLGIKLCKFVRDAEAFRNIRTWILKDNSVCSASPVKTIGTAEI